MTARTTGFSMITIRSLLLTLAIHGCVVLASKPAITSRPSASAASSSSLDGKDRKTPKIQTFEMHPSALNHNKKQNKRNRGLSVAAEEDDEIFTDHGIHPHSNSIYGLLPKQDQYDFDENNTNEELMDFHAYRHFSRYERHYRTAHQIDLYPNWNGNYTHINTHTSTHTSNNTNKNLRRPNHRKNGRYLKPESHQETYLNGGRYSNYQTIPLAQGYGTHYSHIWIGTPSPQRHSVIVDTGSHFTALPCKGCHNCGEQHHTDLYFDFDKSESFRVIKCGECKHDAKCSSDGGGTNIPPQTSTNELSSNEQQLNVCAFQQSYTEGSSWQAYQVQDDVYCANNNVLGAADPHDQNYAIPFMFGCQTSETGLFVTQLADGIMGMSAHEATLPKQMYNHRKIEHNLFTLCFKRELTTSKTGVTAGFMTLGGIDNRLDTSPMAYAQNMANSGWYTVYVKNMFIRTNGGQSAATDPNEQHQILKIPLDLHAVNSGKGVIVDSGTTDTYLNTNLRDSFAAVWKTVVGKEYSHLPLSLTRDQLMRLPTILVQIKAYDSKPDLTQTENTVGTVGNLDPHSRHDVLIAIPAANYMEYSPHTDRYTSRMYFTEEAGGVIGANAMQGHNVLFDWENGRVGFAESSCEYSDKNEPSEANHQHQNIVADDCGLSTPTMSEACVDSVDLSTCVADPTAVFEGTEKWTMVVENAGTTSGMSCPAAALLNTPYTGSTPPIIECEGNGFCVEYRPCIVHCNNANEAKLTPMDSSTVGQYQNNRIACGQSLWGACGYSCTQSRLQSTLMSDSVCHESSRENRTCHIGACGRSDPCRVPFIVHTIVVFQGANAALWSKQFEERFTAALTKSASGQSNHPERTLFDIGDVNVLLTVPWYKHDETGDDVSPTDTAREIGLKVVLEISIFNEHAHMPGPIEEDKSDRRSEITSNTGTMGKLKGMMQNLQNKGFPQSICKESDLYPLAATAMKIQDLLSGENFVQSLLAVMKREEEEKQLTNMSPFQALYRQRELAIGSKVLSSWTIKTEVDEGRTMVTTLSGIFILLIVGSILFVCGTGIVLGFRWGQKGNLHQLSSQESSLIEGIRSRITDAQLKLGRYTDLGITSDFEDDDDILSLIMARSAKSDRSNRTEISDVSHLINEKTVEIAGRRQNPRSRPQRKQRSKRGVIRR